MKTKTKGNTERFTLRPKSIPVLTSVQFRVVSKEMERTPTQTDFDRLERVKRVLQNNLP
jgi:hypothetical protein